MSTSAEDATCLVDTSVAVALVVEDQGIEGGQVYDALVADAAVEHRLRLFTRDRLAVSTYRAVGAEVELV